MTLTSWIYKVRDFTCGSYLVDTCRFVLDIQLISTYLHWQNKQYLRLYTDRLYILKIFLISIYKINYLIKRICDIRIMKFVIFSLTLGQAMNKLSNCENPENMSYPLVLLRYGTQLHFKRTWRTKPLMKKKLSKIKLHIFLH